MLATNLKYRAKPLTESQQYSLIEGIISGNSVNQWCKDNEINPARVYSTIERDLEFARQYSHAKEVQAESFADKLADIADQTLDGKIDPQAARVASDIIKWTASRLLPKRYGNVQQLEVNVNRKMSMIDYALMQQQNRISQSPALELEDME